MSLLDPSLLATAAPGTAAPRVSILMPVRDGEAYLPQAIDSLLAQDLADFQFVIVDDGSGPAARALLDGYAAADPRILLLRNPISRGIPFSLNLGLARCTAPVTARADADDVYLPQRLSRQLAFLDAHPEIGVVSCGWYRLTGSLWSEATSRLVTDPDQIAFYRLFMNQLLHPGTMFRTALVREAGGYDLRFWTAQDSELWARIAGRTRFANLPDRLLGYRIHDRSMVRSRGAEGAALSLSVPAAQLAAYLGEPLPPADVTAAVRLFRGDEPIALADLRRGADLIARVRAAALAREPAHVVVDFERTISGRLRRAALRHRPAAPLEALRLTARALAWRFNPRWAKRVAARTLRRALPGGPANETRRGA